MARAPKKEDLPGRFARLLREHRYQRISSVGFGGPPPAASGGAEFHGVQVENRSVQNINSGSEQLLTWNHATYDTDTFWDSGDPNKLTIPADGVYLVSVSCNLQGTTTGTRFELFLRTSLTGYGDKSGPYTGRLDIARPGGNDMGWMGTIQRYFVAGTYLRAYLIHNSGFTEATNPGEERFSITQLGVPDPVDIAGGLP